MNNMTCLFASPTALRKNVYKVRSANHQCTTSGYDLHSVFTYAVHYTNREGGTQ